MPAWLHHLQEIGLWKISVEGSIHFGRAIRAQNHFSYTYVYFILFTNSSSTSNTIESMLYLVHFRASRSLRNRKKFWAPSVSENVLLVLLIWASPNSLSSRNLVIYGTRSGLQCKVYQRIPTLNYSVFSCSSMQINIWLNQCSDGILLSVTIHKKKHVMFPHFLRCTSPCPHMETFLRQWLLPTDAFHLPKREKYIFLLPKMMSLIQ